MYHLLSQELELRDRNIGRRLGSFVAQVYLTDVKNSVPPGKWVQIINAAPIKERAHIIYDLVAASLEKDDPFLARALIDFFPKIQEMTPMDLTLNAPRNWSSRSFKAATVYATQPIHRWIMIFSRKRGLALPEGLVDFLLYNLLIARDDEATSRHGQDFFAIRTLLLEQRNWDEPKFREFLRNLSQQRPVLFQNLKQELSSSILGKWIQN